jgi:membrane dipeptidase
MLIIDAHLHLAMNALRNNRNMLYSAFTTRSMESGNQKVRGATQGTVALPEMRQGRIALCFDSVVANHTGNPKPHTDYPSPEQAFASARGQMAYYQALEKGGHVRVISDLAGLDSHMAEWERWDAADDADTDHTPPIGIIISMEGADPILEPDELQEWWDMGLRIITLAHYGTGRYAGGTGSESGLTALGAPFLAEMERLGAILDVSHFTDRGFWEALDNFAGPVMASHSTSRTLVPHQRQMTDEQIKAVIERDGVMGATPGCCWTLVPGWLHDIDTNENVSMDTVAGHLDYICQLAGDSRHVAIGTDLDGGFGRDKAPRDLETIADLQKLNGLLADRGYSEEDVANIMYRNWVRFLHQSWKS